MEPVKTSRIYLVAVVSNLSAFAAGTALAWTSPVDLKLKSDDTSDSPLDHKINSTEDSWISSTIGLGALFGSLLAALLTERIGRKWVLLSSSVFLVVSYILMMVAREVWVIVLGRFFQGCCTAFVMTSEPMYLAEISTDNIRGATGSLLQLFLVCGNLYVYAIGPYVSYQALQWFCLATPIVFAVIFFFMPESPYYYAARERKEEAIKSLQFLRGQSAEAVQDELVNILATIEKSKANKGTIAEVIKNPGNRKALIICISLVIFQQFTGNSAVNFNLQSIFETANTGFDAGIESIIIGVVQVFASALTPLIVDRLERRIILLISTVVLTIVLAGMGAYFYIQQTGGDASNILWLPVPALVVYNIFSSVSLAALPWVILGEMFPSNVKSIAGSMVSFANFLAAFTVIYCYPLVNTFGSYYIFWFFAVSCAVAFFFSLFMVMDTKGLSLQEIQDRLNKKEIK